MARDGSPGEICVRCGPDYENGAFRQNAILLKRNNVISSVQSHLQKYFRSLLTQINSELAPSRPLQGRIAIVTNAGRDAMDADGAADERHCGGRRSRVVLTPRCWRQVGGSISADDGDNKPITEESAKETVKTIARGMPGVSGVTVVTMLVCYFYFARETAGASSARHSLRPLNFEAEGSTQNSSTCGEIAEVCVVWAVGALFSPLSSSVIGSRATRPLAMTTLRLNCLAV